MGVRAAVVVVVAAAAAASSCGGGDAQRATPHLAPADRATTDVLELRTTVAGSLHGYLRTSHEWYSPRDGLYRVDHPTQHEWIRAVYDGSQVTRRVRGGIVRVAAADPRALRELTSHPNIIETPGLTVVKAYLHQIAWGDALRVRAGRNGRVLHANWHWQDDTVDEHIPIRVELVARRPLADARHDGTFDPLEGRLVGAYLQRPPGAPPSAGEAAYWFGPTLGPTRAATAIESWGIDAQEPGRGRASAQYQTVYRPPGSHAATFPGLGMKPESDVWVTCERVHGGFLPGVAEGTRPEPVRLATGEPAELYSGGFVVRNRNGVTSNIVVGDTTCLVDGLIPPRTFRRLLPSFRPVR